MRTKKLLALTMVALFALIIAVPLASNATTPNPWTTAAATTIIPTQQDNTPAKAITTEPLGSYVTDGDYLAYDINAIVMISYPELDYGYYSEQISFTFDYNYTQWGDWWIVSLDGASFAIDNTSREIGLNGNELFVGLPANESAITRHTGVYSFLAAPTGIKAGDKIKIMAFTYILYYQVTVEQVTCEVLGRSTAPNFDMTEFYDTWMLSGTLRNSTFSMAPQTFFDTNTGLLVSSITGGSFNDSPYLIGFNNVMTFDSGSSSGGPIPLSNTRIDDFETAESGPLLYQTFEYNESGYWWMDMSAFNASWPTNVKLTSLEGSYLSFTLTPTDSWDVFFGISQVVKIPDNLWEIVDPGWNPTYYNDSTRTGHIESWDNIWAEISELIRFEQYSYLQYSVIGGPLNNMFLAPPWIRDGAVMAVDTILPLFFPDPDSPTFDFGTEFYNLWLLFQVTGAVTVSIDGNNYDCWKAELLLPTDLSDFNLTQFKVELYYERTSGILVKAKADIEAIMFIVSDGGEWAPFGIHKTWTLADAFYPVDLPEPEEMSSYYNIYYMGLPADEWWTLDPSIFNGGSVTVRCSESVSVAMRTQTQFGSNYTTIGGKPAIKFMAVENTGSGSADFNGTVNFYYTPSELQAMGAQESGFSVLAWNGTAWEPLSTTWDAEGRVVSANTSHFGDFIVFVLVASPVTLDILVLGGILAILSYLGQANPMGGMVLPLLGLGAVIAILIIALVILRKPK